MQAITVQGYWGDPSLSEELEKKFGGKQVIITVIEMEGLSNPVPANTWRLLGSINLNGQLDSVNVRDFAYEQDGY